MKVSMRLLTKGLLLGGLVLTASVGVIWLVSDAREQRLRWLRSAEKNQDTALVGQILADLVRESPSDPALLEHWDLHQAMVNEERLRVVRWQESLDRQLVLLSDLQAQVHHSQTTEKVLQSRTDAVQSDLRRFQSDFGAFHDDFGTFQNGFQSFSQLVDQRVAQQQTAESGKKSLDFLYQLFREAPLAQPDSLATINTRLNEGLLAVEGQHWAAAKSLALQILRSQPDHARAAALWMYASVREAPDSPDLGNRVLPVSEAVLQVEPQNFGALYTAAVVYQASGNFTLAEDRFRRACEADPRSEVAQTGWVEALVSLNRGDEARRRAQSLWNQGEKDDRRGLLVWKTLGGAGDQEARGFLVQWKAAVPTSSLPDLYEGDLALRAQDLSGAIAAYQRSWEKKNTKAALQKWCEALYADHQYLAAATQYRSLLKLINAAQGAGRAEFLLFGQRLLDCGTQLSRWSDVVTDGGALLQVIPESAEVRASVGSAYLALGDAVQAQSVLEAGIGRPGGVLLLDDLCEAYWTQKKYDVLRNLLDTWSSKASELAVGSVVAAWKTKLLSLEKKS
jgi:tetratricopeptide (TPR) repeat protein